MSRERRAILLIGDTLNLGGTEGQFVELGRGLDRSRWLVSVACIRAEGPLRARLEQAGVEPWSCGGGSFLSPRFVPTVLRLARRLSATKVDLLHSFDFYSNILAIPAARLARVPVVIASQRDLGELRPRYQHRVHAAALRLATHVLVNSTAVADRLQGTRAARTGRLSVIYNGVDVTRFAPSGATRIAPERTVVGALASLRPYKGLLQLVEAAAEVAREIPRVRFEIWGEGPLRPELEGRIQALGLAHMIRLNGSTKEPENALRRCHLFVHPSLSEASSNVVLEAMATGLPVVATTAGGTPALVEHGRSGLLVQPGNPRALAEAILTVVRDPELADRLATAARARAVAEFSMDRMLQRVDALYVRALGLDGHAVAPVGAPARP
jgi:glycosyltransferase involved in cell wall biosynthesis